MQHIQHNKISVLAFVIQKTVSKKTQFIQFISFSFFLHVSFCTPYHQSASLWSRIG